MLLNQYHNELIGHGSYSQVYSYGKNQAIKVYSSDFTSRYYLERDTLQKIQHLEGIPKIVQAGMLNYQPYIIMDQLSSKSMLLEEDIPRLLNIVKAVHQLNITHSDIKNKNIMYDQHNNLVLIDWNHANTESKQRDYADIILLIIQVLHGEDEYQNIIKEMEISEEDQISDYIFSSIWEDSAECLQWQNFIINNLLNKLNDQN